MAKINIIFNNTNYSIDESSLSVASNALKSHLSTVMSGSGAVINFGGTSYNVDSTKLSTARNNLVSHLEKIAGSGSKVVIGGVEYNVDSAKLASAISEMAAVLGGLQSGGGSSLGEAILAEREYSFIVDNEGGFLTTATDSNFVNFHLTIGNTYKTIWDGAEYTCVANVYNNHIYMGNLSMSVDDASNTGEPFLVHCDDIGNPAIFIKDSNSVHTVGIYKVSGIDAVLAELEYFFYDLGGGELYCTNIDVTDNFVDFSLTSGNTYKVIWDGEEYVRVAGGVTGYEYIGNLAIMGVGENTGEPFVIGVDPSVNHAIIYTLEAGNNSMHTVGIYAQ